MGELIGVFAGQAGELRDVQHDSLPRKFGDRYSLAHILRGLQYFEDAEREPELRLLDRSISWPDVKSFFRDQVRAYMHGLRARSRGLEL